MKNEVLVRYAISSAVTFLTAFGVAVLPFIGDVELEQGALFALAIVGVRAGVKALSEYLLGLKG